MKKELGIDIDGCLNHYHEELRVYIKQHYKMDVPNDDYYIVNALNLSRQEENEFWQYFDTIATNFEPENNSKKIIDKLSKILNINIITARAKDSSISTKSWLEKNKIYYDNIDFDSGDKLEMCKKRNVNIMIEDNPDNALILAKNGIKVLLFNRTYNQNINHENIIRCKNWNQIYNAILLNI